MILLDCSSLNGLLQEHIQQQLSDFGGVDWIIKL